MADQAPAAAIAVAAAAAATLTPPINMPYFEDLLGNHNIEAINTIFKQNYIKKLRLKEYKPLGSDVTQKKVKEEFLDNQKNKQVLDLLYTEAGRLTLDDIDDKEKENVSIISIINIDDDEYYIIPTPICLLYYIIDDLKEYLKDIVCDIDVGELEPISTKPTLGGYIVKDKNELYETLPLKCIFKLTQGRCELIIKETNITIDLSKHIQHSLKASSFNEIKEEIEEQKSEAEKYAAPSHTTSHLSPPPPSTLKLISWNIYYKIRKPPLRKAANAAKKIKEITKFLKTENPAIFFTQESVLKQEEIDDKINKKYVSIGWNTKKSGISINYNNTLFKKASKICRLGIEEIIRNGRRTKTYTTHPIIINDDITREYLSDDTDIDRAIICVKLEEQKNKKIIVFITLHAPHHIYKNDNKLFINSLNECLKEVGHTRGERIIIAGDFNEYYKEGRENVNTIKLKLGGTGDYIPLYLKQKKNTCCGSTDITKDELAEHPSSKPFDLVYDSNNKEPDASVYDRQRTSDHKPILYNFSI